MMKSRIFWRVF